MGRDITLLSQFNLMDYSLLFVIEYNPEYARQYPQNFKRVAGTNELQYPLEPSDEHMDKLTSHNLKLNNAKLKKQVSDAFLDLLAA